jgi:hypothetical protein
VPTIHVLLHVLHAIELHLDLLPAIRLPPLPAIKPLPTIHLQFLRAIHLRPGIDLRFLPVM